MPADSSRPRSSQFRPQLESLLLDFDRRWSPNRLEAVVAKLPEAAWRDIALLELVKVDLERAWQAGTERYLDDYVVTFPELGTLDALPVELIVAEFQARVQAGKSPAPDEYAARFPRRQAELLPLLAADQEPGSLVVPGRPVGRAASPRPVPTELPEIFGRYRILRQIGAGGMGSVHLAEDTLLNRQVALKTPTFDPATRTQAIERFQHEAKAAANLRHANICPVYDVGEIDGIPYLSMAYIDGPPLTRFIDPAKPQQERALAALIRKLALALEHAHRQGIVHRDLKPSNILVDGKKEPMVLDFGLARRFDTPEQARLTHSGTLMGTPAYMAPEQVEGDGTQIGPACDIYSLGVVFYECLTGRLPFEGSVLSILRQITTDEPVPPSRHRPDLDPRLEVLCLQMLAKQPEQRFASMQFVADMLTDYLRQPVREPRPDAPSTPPLGPAAAPRSTTPRGTLVAPPPTPRRTLVEPAARRTQAESDPRRTQVETPSDARRTQAEPRPRGLEALADNLQSLHREGADSRRTLAEAPPTDDDLLDAAQEADWPPQPGAASKKQSNKLSRAQRRRVLTIGGAVLAAFLLLVWGADRLIRTPRGTVRLDVAGTVAEGDLLVLEDGREIPLEEAAAGLRLPAGPHTATLCRGTADLAAIDFTVGSDETVVVRLDAPATPEVAAAEPPLDTNPVQDPSLETIGTPEPAEKQETTAPEKTASSAPTSPDLTTPSTVPSTPSLSSLPPVDPKAYAGTPGLLICPATTEVAQAKQKAWADHLKQPVVETNSIGMKLVLIPPGEFTMGSPESDKDAIEDEKPLGRVQVTSTLRIGQTEITQEQWKRVMGTSPWKGKQCVKEGASYPATHVSWEDADAFCRKLTERERTAGRIPRNEDYRLPTEAAWEYACRAGTTTSYSFGGSASRLGEYAWFARNANEVREQYAHAVGLKKANAWGLYDMHGNLREWCADWYGKGLARGRDPLGPPQGSGRVLRGGCWFLTAGGCRSAARNWRTPDVRSFNLGFRVVLALERAPSTASTESPSPRSTAAIPTQGQQTSTRPSLSSLPPVDPQTYSDTPWLLICPAAAELAKVKQRAWADHLKRPVVETNSIGMKLALIPPGEFLMGSPQSDKEADANEKPQVAVRITKPFRIGQTEVTQGEWTRVMGSRPWSTNSGGRSGATYPATYVDHSDAVSFCRKLSQLERNAARLPSGDEYRLPTEAEWEYACRAGTATDYSLGNDTRELPNYAWIIANADGVLHPVGQKQPNAWGLFDMHGNVWEWCGDGFGKLIGGPDPVSPVSGTGHAARGGAWTSAAGRWRSAARSPSKPADRGESLGFRIVLAPVR